MKSGVVQHAAFLDPAENMGWKENGAKKVTINASLYFFEICPGVVNCTWLRCRFLKWSTSPGGFKWRIVRVGVLRHLKEFCGVDAQNVR